MEREAIAPDDASADIAEKGYRNTILAMSRGAAADKARIAALEATVARLTAAPSDEDVEAAIRKVWDGWPGFAEWFAGLTCGHTGRTGVFGPEGVPPEPFEAALTAFLERRMKGC